VYKNSENFSSASPPRFRFQLKNLCQAFSLRPLDFTLRENRTADGFAKKLRRFFKLA